MKYNVGDKVRIKSLDWWNDNNDGKRIRCGNCTFVNGMKPYCGKTVTIKVINKDEGHYRIFEDNEHWHWTDEMFAGLVEEEIKPEPKFKVGDILFYRGETSGYLKVEEIRVENGEIRYYETSRNIYLVENDPDVFADKVCSVETEETKNNNDMEEKETLLGWIKESDNLRLVPHKDYEIKHDGDNFYLVKKKKEYPTTIEECCEILGLEFNPFYTGVKRQVNYKDGVLHNLKCLLIYRDAYLKLYGEEMGLGKPWRPDWNTSEPKYVISCTSNGIEKQWETTYCKGFAFPTEEMRDAFYENFKELIESCKELL